MNILRIIIVGSLLITMYGCAADSDNIRKPSDQETDIALSLVIKCFESNIEKIDDGISDASTIASALAGICQRDFDKFAAMYVVNENPRVQQMVLSKSKQRCTEFALPFILNYRTRNQKQ